MDIHDASTAKPKFLTPKALASRWEVTAMTLRRWRKAGRIKAAHIGRGIRFAIAEVERFEREAAE